MSETCLKVSEHPTLSPQATSPPTWGQILTTGTLRMQACIFADWDMLRFVSPLHKAETESGNLGVAAQSCDVSVVLSG